MHGIQKLSVDRNFKSVNLEPERKIARDVRDKILRIHDW